jgi:hypothetical protein
MIIVDCEQRSDEWYKARNGIPTTSMFGNIVTPDGKASQSSTPYLNQLLAEWLAGKPVDAFKGNKYTDMGKEREPEGEALYELQSGNELKSVGFIYRDERKLVGSSTDGLTINSKGSFIGVFEQKNPKGSTLVEYLQKSEMPSFYKPQVQGELWITDLEWCDFMVYHPDIGHKIWRVERDERYITLMSGYVNKFIERMLSKREKLQHYKR